MYERPERALSILAALKVRIDRGSLVAQLVTLLGQACAFQHHLAAHLLSRPYRARP